jgi:hypothetical protein
MDFGSYKSNHGQHNFGSHSPVDSLNPSEMNQIEYLQAELYKSKMDNRALEQELQKILVVRCFSIVIFFLKVLLN